MNPEYILPTRKGRLAMLSVLVVAILAALIVYRYSPLVMVPLSALPMCEQLGQYRRLIQLLSLLLVAPGLWLALYGRSILKSGQSPPPGAWVLHRTLVKKGAHVTRVGYFLLGVGVAIALLPLYFWSDLGKFERKNAAVVCADS